MADQLATPADLAAYLKQTNLDLSTLTLLIECATAVVQEAAGGQRIVQVVDDTFEMAGFSDSWLTLPQWPVTAVTSVTLDGVTLVAGTDYKKFGSRLFSASGWQNKLGLPWCDAVSQWTGQGPRTASWQEPSTVAGVYTHGYAAGAQELQFGRSAVLSLAGGVFNGTPGAASESIDDYSITYDKMAAQMETSPFLKAALRKKYGRRAGLVRVG